MKNRKTIELIAKPRPPHFVGDGFRVHNFIPSVPRLDRTYMDPFLVLDYNSKYDFPASEIPKGVGVHPHRGFETVTIAYRGAVQHADSSGGGGIIKEGDVQWMTAASGILHKEFHEKEWSKKGGIFQMVQLWVNLPKKYKMSPPKYQAITADKMGKYFLEDKESYIEVIAGNYKEIKGAASTFTPIHLMNAKLKTDAIASFNFPAHYTTAILVIEGNVKVEDKEIPTDYFVLMAKDGETFTIKASEDAIVLVMSGEPINEPIVSHGPFVMNSSEELIEAFNDFNNGKFGHLE